MKRNKRTIKIFQGDLTPLTDRILIKMGSEGEKIRQRLQLFYQWRQDHEKEVKWEPPLET